MRSFNLDPGFISYEPCAVCLSFVSKLLDSCPYRQLIHANRNIYLQHFHKPARAFFSIPEAILRTGKSHQDVLKSTVNREEVLGTYGRAL